MFGLIEIMLRKLIGNAVKNDLLFEQGKELYVGRV